MQLRACVRAYVCAALVVRLCIAIKFESFCPIHIPVQLSEIVVATSMQGFPKLNNLVAISIRYCQTPWLHTGCNVKIGYLNPGTSIAKVKDAVVNGSFGWCVQNPCLRTNFFCF